jgi:hypothetical protein
MAGPRRGSRQGQDIARRHLLVRAINAAAIEPYVTGLGHGLRNLPRLGEAQKP